nr:short-chain specific acyl-CoA dehydrogenase, mitochondrial-like isoform X1 [Onthophagus taurus]
MSLNHLKRLNFSKITQHRSINTLKLSNEHSNLQKICRKFAEKELKPFASMFDRENKFPSEQIKKLGELGLMSIVAAKKWGGSEFDTLSLSIAVEEISRCCGGTGAIVSIHNSLYIDLVNNLCNDQQKEVFLKPFVGGEIGCFALSEPDAGSDVGNISTTATEKNDYYLLNGTKSWVTSGNVGKAAVVFATIDKNLAHKGITAFLIPIPTPGLTIGKLEDKMGIRASPTVSFYLEDVKVPKKNIIGNVGDGFKIAMKQLDKARIGIASQALGIGQAALDVAVDYVSTRKTFGKFLSEHQAVKLKISDMCQKLESARLLVWRAAVIADDDNISYTRESALAKIAASDAAIDISHNALQILGGIGYVKDMSAERHYRDARITQIYGGVTDILKMIVGDLEVKKHKM